MDNKQKQDALNRIAELIDYVKVQHKTKDQHEVKPANSTKKGKLLYFNRKEGRR